MNRNVSGVVETLPGAKEPLRVLLGSFLFLAAGLFLDLATTQDLVIAIVYNVPIAFAGLANSRRLTVVMVVLALLANVGAGYANALAVGGADTAALLNRGIAALSFLLVGYLTWALRRASSRLTAAALGSDRAAREHTAHDIVYELGGPLRPQAFEVRDGIQRPRPPVRPHAGPRRRQRPAAHEVN